jgi:tetratricopeptide (TPR) repeat protein
MQFPTIPWHHLPRAITIAALCTGSALIAQDASKRSTPVRPTAETVTKPTKLKLTPEQKLGLLQLDRAQSEAPGLQADMHAFVLWQASHGYRRIDPERADSLLKDAFGVTLSIDKAQEECTHTEAELCGTKYWLQKQILQDIIKQSTRIDEVEPLLASAEPIVRQMVDINVFRRYVQEKAFDQARYVLEQMANEAGYFSYHSATELIDALPRERSKDRLGIFSQALESYRQHSDEKYPTVDDPATMVLRFWQDLPSSVVLDAIDQILDRAKDADEEENNIRVGISASKGDAYFSSVYQFRLYQLMPVLGQLDKTRAESLLAQNHEVQGALERYPESLASMGALRNSNTQSGTRQMPDILSIGTVDKAQAAAEEIQHEMVRRQARILAEAAFNPKQALSDAMGLPVGNGLEPEFDPRASTLNSLAQIAATKDPSVSRAALGEIRKIVNNMPARNQARMLAELPEIYLRLGDQDEARNSLNELVKIAGKLYAEDSNLDDPNQAFKGMWPSANLWRHCVAVAARLAPTPVEEIMQEITDIDIKAFERIAFANSLLGADTPPLSIVEKHRNGISASIGL